MINRIAHLLPSMDNTPNPDKRERHLRLLSDSELEKIIKSRDTSGNVNMLHPLEVFLDKTYLTEVARTSLASLQTRDTTDETPDQTRAVMAAMQQRIDFLSWLSAQPQQVYMALYPADDDGLEDIDDLNDLLTDESQDLPF